MVVSCIDTNVYIHAMQGICSAQNIFIESDIVYVPMIVLGELEYGFRNGSKYKRNKLQLNKFLGGPNINVVHTSLEVVEHYGRIKSKLKKQGTPIPENDVWIAACASSLGSNLVSFDQHFKPIKSLDFKLLDLK